MHQEINEIRKEYKLHTFYEQDAAGDAIEQFTRWWNEALNSEIDEVNAMTLATASKTGIPSARIVLLKGYDENGFVFFSNYKSLKGKELAENPHAALIFFWKELERQIRIEGLVEKISAQESDEYFFSRPESSRIGAWASPQSEVIENRELLDENVKKFSTSFAGNIPRPAHWGGYRVMPAVIEFWQGRSSRLHDRLRYTKSENSNWKIERLAP